MDGGKILRRRIFPYCSDFEGMDEPCLTCAANLLPITLNPMSHDATERFFREILTAHLAEYPLDSVEHILFTGEES